MRHHSTPAATPTAPQCTRDDFGTVDGARKILEHPVLGKLGSSAASQPVGDFQFRDSAELAFMGGHQGQAQRSRVCRTQQIACSDG
jgi:hypothetical protein